jgi:hypothetical protein
VSIPKFDILATHTCARALLGGPARDEAKERGMVAGIMRAKGRREHPGYLEGRDDPCVASALQVAQLPAALFT